MRTGTDTLITIRKLERNDREPLCHILQETDVFTKEEIDVAVELMEIVFNDPDQNEYEIYTAVSDQQEVVGFVCIGATPLTEATYDLYWIAVKPSHHHHGVGSQLLQHVESIVQQANGRMLVAETSSQPKYDDTHTFYLRKGYQEVARIHEYYRPGDDLVIFAKYFSHSGGT